MLDKNIDKIANMYLGMLFVVFVLVEVASFLVSPTEIGTKLIIAMIWVAASFIILVVNAASGIVAEAIGVLLANEADAASTPSQNGALPEVIG